MTKITILNNSRKTETLRLTDVPTLAENIRTRVYEQEVNELRTFFPLLTLKRKDDGSLEGPSTIRGRFLGSASLRRWRTAITVA